MPEFDALRIVQPSGREVFAFAATADQLLGVTTVPRMRRSDGPELLGYQRAEVSSHIAEIRRYLESAEAVLPNTIVVAFDRRAEFRQNGAGPGHGKLVVPLATEDTAPPGFVVDGQQRLAAVASCRHEDFPVFVTALIAPDVAEQRKQFVLVNRSKPLPPGLIYELLPEIEGHLPQVLARQRLAARLTVRLNLDPESSLHRRIRTPTCPVGVIKDNSIRKVVLNSLTDGALFEMGGRRVTTGDQEEAMVRFVSTYWEGVSRVFPEAWGLPPKASRLTHGAGIVAMGYLMDFLHARIPAGEAWSAGFVAAALEPLKNRCAWTSGKWIFAEGEIWDWNEPQNVDRDIRVLTNHLRRTLELFSPASATAARPLLYAAKGP